MPALANPRHERFAQLIVEGLMNGERKAYSQGRAKMRKNAAAQQKQPHLDCLRKVKPILDRVRELQAEANKRNESKIDLSGERVGRDLDQASRIAAEQKNASAMVASALGIAKVFHAVPNDTERHLSFKTAQSMQDIGKRLLMTVGCESPASAAIDLAIEANDAFVHRLEQIAEAERGGDAT